MSAFSVLQWHKHALVVWSCCDSDIYWRTCDMAALGLKHDDFILVFIINQLYIYI